MILLPGESASNGCARDIEERTRSEAGRFGRDPLNAASLGPC